MSDGLPHLRYGGLLAHGWVPFPFNYNIDKRLASNPQYSHNKAA
jgi:hypothetical protein